MSSSSDLRRSLIRFKPHQRTTNFVRRDRAQLSFIRDLSPGAKLLMDTTVYIDQLQGKLPPEVDRSFDPGNVWHSSVTESELAAIVGLLDPNHPSSTSVVERVMLSIERRPAHRIVTPDRENWREAGVVAGLLARMQQYGKADPRRAMNNALILLSGAKAGLTVLTRNIPDFDLLQQLVPFARVAFYEIEERNNSRVNL